MKDKQYTGSAYICVVGPEAEIGECRDSIEAIARQGGDARPAFVRATKGFEARQLHLDRWLDETSHPFLLLLDHDMVYAPEIPSMTSLGYREMVQYLHGEISLDKAIELIKRNTRQYAKRQMTWFRRDREVIWAHDWKSI